jgi:hypothetical protein
MPRKGNDIHIPLTTDEALRLALKVKPTRDMPRSAGADKPTKKAPTGHAQAQVFESGEITVGVQQ